MGGKMEFFFLKRGHSKISVPQSRRQVPVNDNNQQQQQQQQHYQQQE